MSNLKCFVCGNEINNKYLQANVDPELKPTGCGIIVCSEDWNCTTGRGLIFNFN